MHVVITGASKGIGRAIAAHFAREGADMFLCSRHMDAEGAWQRRLMEEHPCTVATRNVDLSDAAAVDGFAAEVLAAFPKVDILVNNAGVFEPGSLHAEPEDRLERMLRINLHSAYRLTRHLLPDMMRRRSGHVFNICSVAALQAYPDGGSYSISKWALLGFSRNLREEMKPHGVKVTAVHPGATMTASWDGSGVSPERIMEADDIAAMVVASSRLSHKACVEDIIIRPQLGDL